MPRFAPQHLYERHEKSVLYVVVARNAKRSLGAGWIEYAACDETLAVGEQLLQGNGQRASGSGVLVETHSRGNRGSLESMILRECLLCVRRF